MTATLGQIVIGPPLRRRLAALGLDAEIAALDCVPAYTHPKMIAPRHGDGYYMIIRQADSGHVLAIAGTADEVTAALKPYTT
jgi:hypothetical protein